MKKVILVFTCLAITSLSMGGGFNCDEGQEATGANYTMTIIELNSGGLKFLHNCTGDGTSCCTDTLNKHKKIG